MILVAYVWLSLLCNGKIAEHTFPNESNINAITLMPTFALDLYLCLSIPYSLNQTDIASGPNEH